MKKLILFVALLLPFFVSAQSQRLSYSQKSKSNMEIGHRTSRVGGDNLHGDKQKHQNSDFKRFRVALAFSQSYIPAIHLSDGDASPQFIPTDGLELQFFFNHKFSVKWINEIEFQSYTIKGKEGELESVRENAFLTAIVLGYEVYGHLGLFAGGGYEFEKNEDLWVVRVGAEYAFELPEEWDITPAFIYDIKAESHTAYTLSITIGKKF
ncbi:MAG: hypothetical protein KAG96_05790 [Ichthyobacteriaceae bacterium]|nr:hypothetical protein [Ichthyobacteriaceae bacterium]